MKYLVLFIMLAITLAAFQPAQAQYVGPGWGYAIEGGGARGDNSGNKETWNPRLRGHIQMQFFPQLYGQVGMSYTELQASGIYSTKTVEGDVRLLWGPFRMQQMFPYFFIGAGATKDVGISGSSYLPVIPAGIGVQTAIGSQLTLLVDGGYGLVLSDKLDGRVRSDDDLNVITNKKHDSFFTGMVGLMYSGAPKSTDPDKDGLSNSEEKELGTDPKKADTDGDGLNDGDEVNKYKTDPLKADSDKDGLNDGDEVNKYNTQPLQSDTDSDGVLDGAEVNKYNSDPKRADSDNDGLADGVEVNQYHSDPMKSDTDGDGLNDGDEVNKYRTDMLKMDTDGDGLSDGSEITVFHSNPLAMDTDDDGLTDDQEVNKYKTDPSKADSDGDGLSDSAELNQYKTNPLMVDTDGGGMIDGSEIKANKNPLDPKDDLFEFVKGKKVVLRGINFDTNQSKVLPESEWILEKARASMAANPDVTVVISGHTDSVGSDEDNRTLSQKRAQAVRDWLVAKGIASNRIKVVGKGEAEPMATNDTEEGRAQNRRMEFYVE